MSRFLSKIPAHCLALMLFAILLLIRRSWRITISGQEQFSERLAGNERLLVIFWHGKYLPLLALLPGCRATIFTSRSFRGEIIGTLCRLLGGNCIQLQEHGGVAAMTAAFNGLADHHPVCAMAVDGPRGPRYRVHLGAVELARRCGMLIIPLAVVADRVKILTGRWDKMEIPLPFARLGVVLGNAIAPPSGERQSGDEEMRLIMRQRLDEAERLAAALLRPAGTNDSA